MFGEFSGKKVTIDNGVFKESHVFETRHSP